MPQRATGHRSLSDRLRSHLSEPPVPQRRGPVPPVVPQVPGDPVSRHIPLGPIAPTVPAILVGQHTPPEGPVVPRVPVVPLDLPAPGSPLGRQGLWPPEVPAGRRVLVGLLGLSHLYKLGMPSMTPIRAIRPPGLGRPLLSPACRIPIVSRRVTPSQHFWTYPLRALRRCRCRPALSTYP